MHHLARLLTGALAVLLIVGPAMAGPKRQNDRDRMPNGWEKKNGLDPRRDDAREDADGDLLVNIGEFRNKTDPQNPDTDGDGFTDADEVLADTDPTDPEDNLDAYEEEELDGEDPVEEEPVE